MNLISLNSLHLKSIDTGTEKIRFLLVLLLAISLPFDISYSSIIFLLLCVITLLDLSKEKLQRIPKQIWLFQLIYFLGVIGYFSSFHKSAAGFLLERQLTILLFPVILPIALKINEEKVQLALLALVLATFYAIAYLFVSMFYTIFYEIKMPVIETIFSGAFFNHQFSKPLEIHAGYLSLYVSLSILYCIHLYYQTKQITIKILLAAVTLFLFTGLFFLASRNTFIATFFILLFIFPLFKTKNKFRYLLISIVILSTGFFIITSVPYLKERFFTDLIADIKPLRNGSYINYNTAEPRVERWKGAVELIKKSPVIGYGTGDEIEILKVEYAKRGFFISYLENFNSHNQYISYLLKNGITGLCIFLFAFCYYLSLAILKKDFMYLSFLLLLLIGFYTENILDSNKGIVFFALFNTLFGYSILSDRRKSLPGAEV